MIQNLVGPPMQGLPAYGMKEKNSDAKGERSDSFGKALEEKMSSKNSQKEPGADMNRPQKIETANKVQQSKPEKQERSEVSKKEPETAETRVTPKATGPLNKKAASEREKAIQKFMDSFESEFGIPSARIVEAMANLNTSQIQKSPEDTADAVISQLDLSDQEKEKASAMYAGLLDNLNKLEVTQKPLSMVSSNQQMMSKPFIQERFQSSIEKKMAINNSLDKMNQKFWMMNAKQESAMNVGEPMSLEKMNADQFQDFTQDNLNNLGDGDKAFSVAQPSLLKQESANQASVNQADLQKLVKELKQAAHQRGENLEITPEALAGLKAQQARDVDSESDDFDSAGNVMLKANGEDAYSQMSDKQAVQRFGQRDQADSFSHGERHSDSNKQSDVKSHSKGEFTKALKTNADAMNIDAIRNQNELQKPTGPVVAGATAQMKMSPEEHDANIKQLMNQAQYLVTKGGGEMKVQMSPEGLGHVHLKVMFENGKVNVQMAAESNEAKKAIESSLADLKSSLAAHKLSVDHIKVDVVAGANTDNNTRNDMNMNPNAQRDSAKQFWNQFQESFGNRGQRDGYLDVGSLKGYQTQKRDPLQPIEAQSVKTGAYAEGKGRGIDLVA